MKRMHLLSLALAALMALTMLSGCGNDTPAPQDGEQTTTTAANGEQTTTTTAQGGEQTTTTTAPNTAEIPESNEYEQFPEGFSAQKIGPVSVSPYEICNNGIIYRKDNKYGLMTFDGKNDTGAKYVTCDAIGNYFKVSTTKLENVADAASLNCVGAVDITGKEIVPMEYATVDKINDRYLKVCKVTEQTATRDDALVYYSNDIFSFGADEDDIYFKGSWYIFDTVAGKTIDNVTGSNSYMISGYGDLVKYVTDDEKQVVVNHNGKALPADAHVLDNGYYYISADYYSGTVYDSENNKVFEYKKEDYMPSSSMGDGQYFSAYKTVGDQNVYVLLDLTGKVVSAEFPSRPYVYGDLVEVDGKLYDFQGKAVTDTAYTSVYLEKFTKNAWILKNDKHYTLIKKDGTVLYDGEIDDSMYFSTSDCYIYKKVDDKTMYYSFADKDFTLEGSSIAPWLVSVSKADDTRDLVDTLSGDTIISGYDYYAASAANSMIYVYAKKGDTIDLYVVK